MFRLHANLKAEDISRAVNGRLITAREVVEYYLSRIKKYNGKLLAFTHTLNERALKQADAIDTQIKHGEHPGELAGVPFAVKNLYDIRGLTTLAGSKINQHNDSADSDSALIQRLENHGAILIGALSMGEYAYDFTGENTHYGNCANPWDTSRMSGGSSSGSGASVAGMLVPLSLGSDTNGSIRVPSSFCGLFGLKPTYGRLPRTGSFPFCHSLDHLGPMARCVSDLAISFAAMQGFDSTDHACANVVDVDVLSKLSTGIDGIVIGKATGYFNADEFPQAQQAAHKVCRALKVKTEVDIRGTKEGRSAAYIITNAESSRLHLTRLQQQPQNFDHDTRDRFIAGAMLPSSWYIRALQTRHWYQQQALHVFKDVDILIAPATPCVAPKIGEKTLTISGEAQPLRPNLGYFTQPISALGFPSCVIPTLDNETKLPIGVQIIAAPWREDLCLRVAKTLEDMGFRTLEASGFID